MLILYNNNNKLYFSSFKNIYSLFPVPCNLKRELYSGPAERIFKGRGAGGGLMRTRKREQTRGIRKNFKFKSSKMAINASKTANSNQSE